MPRPIGVRIKHRTEVAPAIVSIPAAHKPFPVRQNPCNLCGIVHEFRVYHLWLEGDGSCIVSPSVYGNIKDHLGLYDFDYVNEVHEPPPLGIGVGNGVVTQERARMVIHQDLGANQ